MFTFETIIAPATAPGRSAVALLRMSGPQSREILNKIFQPSRTAKDWPPWKLRTGAFVDPTTGETLDSGMAVWMAAPHSYTGEESAEFTCHGSTVITERLLRIATECGARLADPGEFTRRAFLNGKIDMVQAEAVCDLVAAETEAAAELARKQLAGTLSNSLNQLREQLLDLSAEVEAHIDFPEEDIPQADLARMSDTMDSLIHRLDALLASSHRGRRLREGARIAIVGRTNVGKSSLFNAIVGAERAIATPHPGTTRDTIEARIDLGGIAVNLIDTAGIRESENEIEQAGIERSIQELERADLLLWVLDGSVPLTPEDESLGRRLAGCKMIVAQNKSDLSREWNLGQFPLSAAGVEILGFVQTSAKVEGGVDELERAIERVLLGEQAPIETVAMSNIRHIAALEQARDSLISAAALLDAGESLEFAATDLNAAGSHLDEILGIDARDDLLDRIFEKFCIGK